LVFEIVLANVPDGRLFGLDAQTFISVGAQLINFAILAFVLSKLLYKPVGNFLRKRADRIEGQLVSAEEEMAKAMELKLQYEQKLEEVARERDAILGEARKLAAETSQRLIAEAKKEADAVKERTTANVELEWERAQTDMRLAIIEVSALMSEKFVTLAINKETHDRLFDETMADLEGMTWRD
jgi:F-type H+-transporting ATPase subunit b